MGDRERRPIEIILARGLMSYVATPCFLVDISGTVVFFNDAAGVILGVRYEEAGAMSREEWSTRFAPIGDEGQPFRVDELPLLIALHQERPNHRRMRIRSASGGEHEIEVSAFPIVGSEGVRGAMAIFWECAHDM
jgi:PAS domain-containing protein